MDLSFVPYRLAAEYLRQRLQEANIALPVIGIICGSGLSGLSSTLQEPTLTVPYADIPGFPSHCTVAGHKGEVVFGYFTQPSSDDDDNGNHQTTGSNGNGIPAICFRGRFHSYEGHDMKTVVLPVYVMRCLSVQVCIITNAAGGLNPNYSVGQVVCVSDHLALPQLAGKNSLIGKNDDELGPRFPATSNAYSEELRQVAKQAADELGMDFVVPHGVYCFVSGPMYESKAECRFLRSLGGDAVGMSTIPEVVSAHHCDMKTLCLSLITNQVIMTGDEGAPVASHAEVLEAVQARSQQMQALVQQIVRRTAQQVLPKLPPLSQVSLHVDTATKASFYESQDSGNNNNNNHNIGESRSIAERTILSWAWWGHVVAPAVALLAVGAYAGARASASSGRK